MAETAVIIDTETTGVDDEDEVIELAQIELLPNLEIVEDTTERFRPKVAIKFGAMGVHHLHESDLENCLPTPSKAKWSEGFSSGIDYFIGHNVDFDWKMLGRPPVRRICTLAIARTVLAQIDSHTLGAVLYALKGVNAREHVKGAHAALEDCYLVHMFLKELKRMPNCGWNSWEDLWLFSQQCRIPKIMSFGKWKGQQVQAVDMGYRTWYRKQPDPDPWLLKAWGYNVDTDNI